MVIDASGLTCPASEETDSRKPVQDEVLDVEAVRRLLRLGRNTVYELVGRNAIPHRRVGKNIRFSRMAIMTWLASWAVGVAKEGK